MRRILLPLILLTFHYSISAQNNNVNNTESIFSYEQEILRFENKVYCDTPKDTVTKYGSVLRKTAKLYENVDVTRSIVYELKYLSLQRQYGFDSDTLTTYTNIGKYYKEDENYDSAKYYLSKALSLTYKLASQENESIVNLYIQTASLYGRINKPDSAFVYSEKAKNLELKINGQNTEKFVTILMNSALYKYKSGDVTNSLRQLRKVHQHPKCNKLNTAFNIAGIYSAQGDADSCYEYLAEAWDIIQKEVVLNIENLSEENRYKYFTTEQTYKLITAPINYFLQHKEHNGLLRLAYNCILFYKKIGIEITSNNINEVANAISFDTIKGFLKENEIAIELWSDLSGSWYSDYILAFIVSPNEKNPIFVALPKDSIYLALNNEIETSRTFLPLYETMWKSLVSTGDLSRNGRIYISCDDVYSIIPFESIRNYDSEYLGDIYSIYRVSYSGNIKSVSDDFKIGDAALYGGLRYDCSDEEKPGGDLASNNEYLTYDTLSSNDRGSLRYLPWTQVEIDSIYAILQSLNELGKVLIINGEKGTEESFVNFSGSSPSIIHLATHGCFFQPTEEMSWYEYYKYCMENSGILLSCCANYSINGNGFLSSEKIRKLDLSKTSLLVLSACNTGVGGVTPYGIIGLQNAFKQAGVGSIIMTLGRVDDIATQFFMTSFYSALASGMTPREAFKNAQYAIRTNEYFKEFNYWAYFVMLD